MTLRVPILIGLAIVLLVVGLGVDRNGALARELGARLRRMAPERETDGPELERDRRLSQIAWVDRSLRRIRMGALQRIVSRNGADDKTLAGRVGRAGGERPKGV